MAFKTFLNRFWSLTLPWDFEPETLGFLGLRASGLGVDRAEMGGGQFLLDPVLHGVTHHSPNGDLLG